MIAKTIKICGVALIFIFVAAVSAYFTVSLIVKSEDTVIVPELTGKDVVYALEILTDMGLNTKVRGSEYSESVPKNHIVYQEPKPGIEIKKGRDVKIILSKGTQSVLMPNLVGLPDRQVQILLEENGLCRGNVALIHYGIAEPNTVIAHFPLPGAMVTRNSCVDLLINQGALPVAYKMPVLTGLSFEDAVLLIERSGLDVGEVDTRFAETQPIETVIEQQPPAGHRIPAGSMVAITVNRPPSQNAELQAKGFQSAGVFRHWVDTGILNKRIRVTFQTQLVVSDLFDDYVKPGQEIILVVPDFHRGVVFLYVDGELQSPAPSAIRTGWAQVFRSPGSGS